MSDSTRMCVFVDGGEVEAGAVAFSKRKEKPPCEHGVRNGGQFCEVGKRLGLKCGSGLCVHLKQKYCCKQCGTLKKRVCEHGNRMHYCKTGRRLGLPCGSGLCKHFRQNGSCVKCGVRKKKGGVPLEGVLQGPRQKVWAEVLLPVEAVEACAEAVAACAEACVGSEEECYDDYEGELPDFGD